MRDDHPDPAADSHRPSHPSPRAEAVRPVGGDTPGAAGEAHEVRTPEEYTEPPGSHRRPDGTATDVGG